jgi:CheY-like chemotaxis protein
LSWNLLIVEDDADTREVLAEIFVARGYRVWTAENGLRALEIVAHQGFRPDVVLLDHHMPVMDAESFIVARQRESLLATTPIIVLSGDTCRAPAGVHAVVRKPVTVDELIALVAAACHGVAPPARE